MKFKTKWKFSPVEFCQEQKIQWQAGDGDEPHRCALLGRASVCVLSKVWRWPRLNFWLELQRGWRTSNWGVSWALRICLHPELSLIGEHESIPVNITALPNESIYSFLISSKKEIECLFPSEHLQNTKYCYTKPGTWQFIVLSQKTLALAKNEKSLY